MHPPQPASNINNTKVIPTVLLMITQEVHYTVAILKDVRRDLHGKANLRTIVTPIYQSQMLIIGRKHERIHHKRTERPHQCDACDGAFLWPKDLRRHKRSVHEEAKEIHCPCADCPFSGQGPHRRGFSRKDKMLRHYKRKHKTFTGTSVLDVQDDIGLSGLSSDPPSMTSSMLSDSSTHSGPGNSVAYLSSTQRQVP